MRSYLFNVFWELLARRRIGGVMTRQTLKNLEIVDVIHGTSCVRDDAEGENRVALLPDKAASAG
jgi:hypothetical protein